MSRIAAAFKPGRKALIPYICAGDPSPDTTVAVMHALVRGGADVIELGVPFSDPMADGPVIQKASERALAKGVGMPQVLGFVREFRQTDNTTPVVLMGYANPIERYGVERFVADAHSHGVDGVLVVDYPPEEAASFAQQLQSAQIDPIFLLAPTSTEERMAQVGHMARGYVYYVSLKGVTGAGHLDVAGVAEAVPRIRRHVNVPVGVGFGIRDAESAKAVGRVSDAVVIGSRLVQILENQQGETLLSSAQAFMADIRRALDELKD
jgi:tryptophan synthase alpha chain